MASISGLSGFDAGSIVEQLMQLEAVPQSRLKTRVSSEQLQLNSLQTLNAKLASLVTKATAAADTAKWGGLTATSSSDKVAVTVTASATAATLDLHVARTAAAHQQGSTSSAAAGATVLGPLNQVRVDRMDGTVDVYTAANGTLQGLVDRLNDPARPTGLRASLVGTGDGSTYKLLVESTTTGLATDFALTLEDGTALLGGMTTSRAASDAEVRIGSSTGMAVTSSTNTFEGLLAGADVTVQPAAVGTTATVTVAPDKAGATKLVKELVDGLNAALNEMRSLTAYGSGGLGKGMLAGDSLVRSVQAQLQGTLFGTDGASLAPLGIQADRTGTFTFDEAAFTKAWSADPSGVASTISTGFATRVKLAADGASNKDTGTVTAALTGRKAGIDRLNDSIEAWDTRLEMRRTALTRQFTALETALSRMNSQSTWLAGQISSLPTMSA